MANFFNTLGVCFSEKHYMVDPLKRQKAVRKLIKKNRWLHQLERVEKFPYRRRSGFYRRLGRAD